MTTLTMAQQILAKIAGAELAIGAADANIELDKPRIAISRQELEKAQRYIDEARTCLARILLNEGGLRTEEKK